MCFRYIDNDKKISLDEFKNFVNAVDSDFVPSLIKRIDIVGYYNKIISLATIVTCRNEFNDIVGLCATYDNDTNTRLGYVTLIAVLEAFRGKGIASELLIHSEYIAKERGMNKIRIHTSNPIAKSCYLKAGFSVIEEIRDFDFQVIRYCLEKEI